MKSTFSIKSAILAGILGTAAMTLFTYMAPLMGFEMNIPRMLADTMGAPIIIGWLAHLMIGVILSVNYAALFLKTTGANPGIKSGSVFSLIPWLAAQIMVMPMMSILNGGSYLDGLLSGSLMVAMASLVGHVIFGSIVGLTYKKQAEIIVAHA